MRRYLANRSFRIGFWLFVIGSGPLLAVILAAKLGLTRDPNPNPVGFGILAMLTFWPSIILMLRGVAQLRDEARDDRS
jgi:hypothetical protein